MEQVADREAAFEAARAMLRVAFDLTIMVEDMRTSEALDGVRVEVEEEKERG